MMSTANTVSSEPFLSLESKGVSSLTVEEERNYYRQRFLSMKLVLKELQQQLALYKTRCAGVDTVALMLKESKQEVVKLTRQRKALETAVANLQNRLSTNGLSSSVNIEETELFVPGASKQTLDNLARENARLRSLLKNAEAQSGKKGTEDVQSLKTCVENLEAENNQLKAQLLEMEEIKLTLTKQYEDVINELKDKHEVIKQGLEQELEQYVHGKKTPAKHNEEDTNIERKSKGCQTDEVELSKVEEIRKSLKLLSEQCLQLDITLESAHIPVKQDKQETLTESERSVTNKDIQLELERKLHQVIEMNQRWQVYSDGQEQKIRTLVARVTELEGLTQENDKFRNSMESKEHENLKLRRELDNLRREISQRRTQPEFDMSIVEILKQQIQVCTEDFNTERKDREQAVNRAKQLQEDVNKLTNENDMLKKDIENMRKVKNTQEPHLEMRDAQSWGQQQVQQSPFKARGGQLEGIRIPFSTYSPPLSASNIRPSLSLTSSPAPMSLSSVPSSAGDKYTSYAPSSQENVSGSSANVSYLYHHQRDPHPVGSVGHSRTSTGSAPDFPPSPISLKNSPRDNVSMPALSRKMSRSRDEGERNLSCPKCNRAFSDSELLSHIDSCRD